MNRHRVTLDSCVAVTEKLLKITECVSRPNSLNAMLCTNDGSVFLTKSVTTIIQALNGTDPVERLIVNGLLSYIRVTGDDSNNFLIMLHAILINVRSELIKSSVQLSSALFHCMVRKLVNDMFQTVPEIIENLKKYYQETACVQRMEEIIWSDVTKLILTSLEGSFTRNSSYVLNSLIVKLLKGSTEDISSLPKVIDNLISRFDKICIEISGKFLSDSRVDSGLLIRYSCKQYMMDALSPVIIVLLDMDEKTDSTETVSILNNDILTSSIICQAASLQSSVSNLSILGVNLIMCSGRVPANMLYECKKNNITCLSYVDNEDLQMLSELSGTPMFQSLKEVRSLSDCLSVTSAKTVFLGGNQFLHMPKLLTSHKSNHLLICAPTIKLCHEYQNAILNCLRTIRMSFENFDFQTKEGSEQSYDKVVSMSTIKTGGLFEFLCSYYISNGEMNVSKNILKSGFLSIPYDRHKHSNLTKKAQLPLQHLEYQFMKQLKDGFVTSINRKSGCLIPVEQEISVEPVGTKLTMIFHVFNLLLQLSRIDHIMYVADRGHTYNAKKSNIEMC